MAARGNSGSLQTATSVSFYDAFPGLMDIILIGLDRLASYTYGTSSRCKFEEYLFLQRIQGRSTSRREGYDRSVLH